MYRSEPATPTRVAPRDLQTDRLILRVPEERDAAAFIDAIAESFAELGQWMDWAAVIPGLDEERATLIRRAAAHDSAEESSYALWNREDGRLIGSAGLPRPRWKSRAFEIGYWVRTSEVGRGFATECARELTRLAFADLGARRVEIRTSTLNLRSRGVAERLGYRHEATLPGDGTHPDGSARDTAVYAAYAGTEALEYVRDGAIHEETRSQ